MADIGRQADIKELRKDLATTKDPKKIRLINQAGEKIRKEQSDGWVTSARRKMIAERQAGRIQNVRDIQHDMIDRKNKAGTGSSKIGFALDISQEDWDRIFKHK